MQQLSCWEKEVVLHGRHLQWKWKNNSSGLPEEDNRFADVSVIRYVLLSVRLL